MSTRESGSPVESLTSSLPVGAVAGTIAFVVNYVAVYLFLTVEGVSAEDGDMWKVSGRTLFNSHLVSTEVLASGLSVRFNPMTGNSTDTMGWVMGETEPTSTIPSAIYLLLPIVVLIAAGFLVYKASNADAASAAAGAGASVAVGYLVLSVVGYFLFQSSPGNLSIAPEPLPAILLAGLAYPLVCGAIGGAIGQHTD